MHRLRTIVRLREGFDDGFAFIALVLAPWGLLFFL